MAYFQADTIRGSDYGYGYDDKPYNSSGYAPDPVPYNHPPAASNYGDQEQQIQNKQQQQQQQQMPEIPASNGEKKKPIAQTLLEKYSVNINFDLLISKTFYFFFFAAFGSLFPLIGIYFKQLGMNPAQTGLLIGFRPFIELVAGPFWNNLAFRYKKLKKILIFSLVCWIVFTLSLAYVQTEPSYCLVHNTTHVYVAEPYTIEHLDHHDINLEEFQKNLEESKKRVKRGTMPNSFQDQNFYINNGFAVLPPLEDEIEVDSAGLSRDINPYSKLAVEYSDSFVVNATINLDGDDADQGESEEQYGTRDEGKEDDDDEEPSEPGKSVPHMIHHALKSHADASRQSGSLKQQHNDNGKAAEKGKTKEEKPYKEEGNKNKPSNIKTVKEQIKPANYEKSVRPVAVVHPVQDVQGSNREENYDKDNNEGENKQQNHHGTIYRFKNLPFPEIKTKGYSPLPIDHNAIVNLNEAQSVNLVSPPMSAVVYRLRDVQSIFLILLVLQIIGEFLSTPAISMADIATLEYVNNDVEQYGRQRMYGSVGWAVSMFFVGIALDYSNVFPNHPCGTEHIVDRNYMTCYAIFGVLMAVALLVATQFRFKVADTALQNIQLAQLKDKVFEKVKGLKGGDQTNMFNDVDSANNKVQISLDTANKPDMVTDAVTDGSAEGTATQPSPFIPRGIRGHPGTIPQWITVLKLFAPIQYSSMLFILWYVGFGVGLVFSFLFWHLQDIRGTPVLFGIASVVSHVSEIAAFFLIRKLVTKFGYLNVIYGGLSANFIRFIFISLVSRPWWVLPFELLQGLTHAGVWAAGCSYLTQFIPVASRPAAQVILISLHHALGRGCGAIIGGALINSYGINNFSPNKDMLNYTFSYFVGSVAVFRGYGISCIIVTAGFVALHFLYVSKLPPAEPTTTREPNGMSMETAYLAPHGVPSAMPHSMSNSHMEKDDSYGRGGGGYNGYMESGASRDQQYGDIYNKPPSGVYEDYGYGYSKDTITDDQIFWNSPKQRISISQQNNNSDDLAKKTKSRNLVGERLIMGAAPKAPVQTHLAQPQATYQSFDDTTSDYLY